MYCKVKRVDGINKERIFGTMDIGSSKRLLYIGESDEYRFSDENNQIIRVAKDKLIGASFLKMNDYCTLKRQTYACYVVFS